MQLYHEKDNELEMLSILTQKDHSAAKRIAINNLININLQLCNLLLNVLEGFLHKKDVRWHMIVGRLNNYWINFMKAYWEDGV